MIYTSKIEWFKIKYITVFKISPSHVGPVLKLGHTQDTMQFSYTHVPPYSQGCCIHGPSISEIEKLIKRYYFSEKNNTQCQCLHFNTVSKYTLFCHF